MDNLKQLADTLPDAAKDIRLNLSSVLGSEVLSEDQRWGIALTSAYFLRDPELLEATLSDARAAVGEAVLEDAKAAAALMGMNTVFYRFRHMIGKESYAKRPAQLRMTRMKQVATDQTHFELYSIGPAALAGCELCLKAHEAAVKKGGLNEDNVHDAVRIASVLHGIAVALEMGAAD